MRDRARRRHRPAQECVGCGSCCEEFGGVLAAEEADLTRWRREGRLDLLSRVGEGGALWVSPDTGEELETRPFFERLGPGEGRCAIHETKPDMCRAYPTLDHGCHCLRGIRFPGA